MIISFLALLELVKQKIITAKQNQLYGDITIKKQS
jgi:chromatin segregation and condensation protein Rec8/ScpA/Scc1 (kleisin family)